MSNTTNTNPNEQQVNDCCIMCLKSFGIVDECIPRKCIKEKCGRHFCTQCVRQIQVYNGNDRPFQCMYCLHKYSSGQVPAEDEQFKKKLWNNAIIKCSIKRTRNLLSTKCDRDDLMFDIDCRRRHLNNLISTLERLNRTPKTQETMIEAENMANKLAQIALDLRSHPNENAILQKAAYRQAISLPDIEDDVGSLYIHLCERLFIEIAYVEFCSIFPNTNEKMNQWICKQKTGDGFQPKIFDLIKAVEQDLKKHWSNPRFQPRTKIGVIGYTSAGKSSVLNRLLGVNSLADENAAPVRTIKSTFYQLQFDRQEPLIYPPNRDIQIPVTFIDIQGLDKDVPIVTDQVEAGNYLDEIRKADCDIYVLVFDDQFRYEQEGWIDYIEQTLERKCVLVRSKVDICYLKKFRERASIPFGRSTSEQFDKYDQLIVDQIRYDNQVKLRQVFLTAADYDSASTDAEMLLSIKSFDGDVLFDTLSCLAFNASNRRIRLLTMRAVARVINTCFRRGYVLNVLKYKIAAGLTAIIPFGDQLPRYLSRNSIREAFGINEAFCQYLTQFNLIIQEDGHLQTSVFKECVTVSTETNSKVSARTVGTIAGHTTAVAGSFGDDIIRIAAPTIANVPKVASTVFTVATIGIGVVISAGVCAWSAISSGRHIFCYVNRTCDDLILVINPLIASIIEEENKKRNGNA